MRHPVRVSFLLRVVLPDRPGALGAVASALGEAGADILSVDIVERSAGAATDDLVLELPPGRLPDSLVTAAAGVPGVRVESIRPYAGTMDPHRELELLDRLAAEPHASLTVLADGVTRVFRAGWSIVLDEPVVGRSAVLAAGGAAPEVDALHVPWWPPAPTRVLAADEPWVPPEVGRLDTELAVTPLGSGAVLVGRPALHWLRAELVRLQHLAAIAATVTAAESGAH
jgi:hypothetical protein